MDSIVHAALTSDSDHVVKLVYSCFSLASSNQADAPLFTAVARSAVE
jgi:hypothetical protein